MRISYRPLLRLAVCLSVLLALSLPCIRAGAQSPCPTDDVTITALKDPNGNLLNASQTLAGEIDVYWQATATAPTGWRKTGTFLDVYSSGGATLKHQLGQVGGLESDGSAYANWNAPIDPDGTYQLAVEHDWTGPTGNNPPSCVTYSPRVTVTVANGHPVLVESSTTDELTHTCSCTCDAVVSHSETHPLTGSEEWSIPLTGWYCRGKRYEFALSYNSLSLVDPQGPPAPELTGLSEHNSKWSQPFSQWISLFQDQQGTTYAVWHHDGTYLSFPKSVNSFTSPDSFHTLTPGASQSYPLSYTCGGSTISTTVSTYSSFTLKDAANTEYDFNSVFFTTGSGSGGSCEAIPHFLLTRIADRWGRTLTITWLNQTVGSGSEPRVASVVDDNGNGIALNYGTSGGLLQSVTDPQGRTHTLGYSSVPDENNVLRQKLSAITVKGPGSPTPVTYSYSFLYQAPNDPNNTAYGGTYTGDLVVQKTEPDSTGAGGQMVTSYQYEFVTLPRSTPRDWDGRVKQISWPDNSEGTNATRVITRTKNSDTQATMTFPGNAQLGTPQTQYNYTGVDLTSVTELAGTTAARTWTYNYDNHNLHQIWSQMETGNPLVEYDYLYYGNGFIQQVTRTERVDSLGHLGHSVVTTYNNLGEPMQVTADADAASGNHTQAMQFWYDGYRDGTSVGLTGNLTATQRGWLDTTTSPPTFHSLEEADISYSGTPGAWGLPDTLTNPTKGISTLQYDSVTGLLTNEASPANANPEAAPGDVAPSATVLQYTADGLPSLVTDPMGHQIQISYNAQGTSGTAASNLVITRKQVPAAFLTQTVTVVDPKGRVLSVTDENGVTTQWTYNPQGQVKTVTEGISTPAKPEQRTTTDYYNDRGDLTAIDPPNGSGGRISFDYSQYDQSGNLVTQNSQPIYMGRLTRISYPVTIDYPAGTAEFFGYNPAGELSWHRKADATMNTVVSFVRDPLHRITEVDYPASGSNSAFNVTTQFDEFGRAKSRADSAGTTLLAYDDLNRPASITPPSPQHALTFSYTADQTYHRWITAVAAAGVGTGPYQYLEDSKGRTTEIVNAFGQVFGRQFDPDGKLVLSTFPNNIHEERCYTPQDQIASLLYRKAGGTIYDYFAYYYTDGYGGHDLAGHILREVNGLTGYSHAFAYNNLYELVQESDPYLGAILYGYDANGNRTSRQDGYGTAYYGVDANNKLQWVNLGTNAVPTSGQANAYTLFHYDAVGRTIYRERKDNAGVQRGYTFSWDGDDRLRSITSGATSYLTAAYDGDGLRITKSDLWTGTHNYSWGPGGVLTDDNGQGNVYTPGLARRQGSTDRFMHGDWLGSTRYLSDSSGNSFPNALLFDAFGNRGATSGTPYDPIDFQFAGGAGYQTEYADATNNEPGVGLQYLQQRYYDPAVGRFISPDPLGFAAGTNLYEYADDDPVNGVDPWGLDTLVIQKDPGGAGFGAHARIYLSARDEQPDDFVTSPPTSGRWFGYYPANPNGNRGSSSLWNAIREAFGSLLSRGGGNGPGYVQAYDTPGLDQWRKGNHVFVTITREQGLQIFAKINERPRERYNLERHNCSTWAGEVLQPAFPNIGRIKTPRELFNFFSTGAQEPDTDQ